MPGSPASPTPAPWRLLVRPPGASPFAQPVGADGLVMGRSREADLQLHDDSLSRRHARFYVEGSRLWVEDLGSRNGTFLNDAPLRQAAALDEGDQLLLGATRVEARRDGGLRLAGEAGTELPDATAMLDATSISGGKPHGLFRDLEQENRALSLLSEAGKVLIGHRPLQQTLEALLDLTLVGLDAERAALALLPEGDAEAPPELACVRGRRGAQSLRLSSTVARVVIEGRKAVAVTDVDGDPRVSTSDSVRIQGVHTLMCAPLWDGTRVQGLLYVDRRLGRGSYGEADLTVLSLLANVIAIKLENAQLIEQALQASQLAQELDVARRIQQKLMPSQAPGLATIDLHAECMPCHAIGGDFYDWMPLRDGAWGVVVADVCGKGVGGALLAACFQSALRVGRTQPATPSQRLASLNEFVHQMSTADSYITAAWVELDPATGALRYALAGHPPPLIVSRGGATRSLKAGGIPLGMFPEAIYDEGTDTLAPGERLVLYTDGITEAGPKGSREPAFGTRGLTQALAGSATAGARAACGAVLEALDEYTSGAPLQDDATVLVAARAG